MIARNEAQVIARCLESVRGLVDSWSIVDTGSTDGTPDLVLELLSDLPGELHTRPWVDFAHNRTEAVQLARGGSRYLLLLDADMTVSFDLASMPELVLPSYLLRYEGDFEYWQALLVRSDLDWRYVGSTHEYITCPEANGEGRLSSIVVHHHADGGSRAGKLERDLELLTRDRERDPEDVRTVFYLAQTHRDLGNIDTAIRLYDERAAMGGWAEEVFYSQYQAGALRAENGDWSRALTALLEAWQSRPARLEPLYEAVKLLRAHNLHEVAHPLVLRGLQQPQPDDVLFVDRWLYDWGFLFEFSITAYWTGDPQSALTACDRLLARGDLPDAFRAQTIANRDYCVAAVGRT